MPRAEWTWDKSHYMERTVPIKCAQYRSGRVTFTTFMTWRCHKECPCIKGKIDTDG